jgi:hypothetical protein
MKSTQRLIYCFIKRITKTENIPLKNLAMKFRLLFLLISIASFIAACNSSEPRIPLSVNPQNPHYFLFRDKPTILIGSTEHYGAVMNLDFDYIRYLNELASCGLNVTRTFSGVYVEPSGAFGIKKNTLAPAPLRYICPWPRSTEPGYANGGNKFDLSEWDEAYFTRLKDFIREAGKRNIVVELDLFSNFYDTVQWKLSPLNAANNINRVGDFNDHKEVLSLMHPELLNVQENMVRKIIHELKDFDNLYYEVCNEPYFGDTIALRQWEDHMTGVVYEAEKDMPFRHLISNNVANHRKLVESPRPFVSIYNFHYARPPVTVQMNYHLNSVIGDNETGFDGIEDAVYRMEAWNFILSGGGLFDNLDYSFTVDNEDGSYVVGPGQPGGGNKELRHQFSILADFMRSVDFVRMKPVPWSMFKMELKYSSFQGLTDADKLTLLYFSGSDKAEKTARFEIDLPAGSYKMEWVNTTTGKTTVKNYKSHRGGWLKVVSPGYMTDIAIKIRKTK